ncbi:MAG: hypothetical protein U0892_00175 [Pirellulales bacterium]
MRLPTVYSVVFARAHIATHAIAGDRQEETITHANLFVIKADVRSEKDTIRSDLPDMTEGIRQTILVELTNNTDSDWHDIHGIGSCSCIGGRDLDGKSCAVGETISFELKLKPTQDAYRQAFELRRRDNEAQHASAVARFASRPKCNRRSVSHTIDWYSKKSDKS